MVETAALTSRSLEAKEEVLDLFRAIAANQMADDLASALVTYMKNTHFIGTGWVEVPEAKLVGDDVTGWVVKRDLWFFALYAQVTIKIHSTLSQANMTRFVVKGSESGVKNFQKILKRAVELHNQPRFPNMIVPMVRWEMKIRSKEHDRRQK